MADPFTMIAMAAVQVVGAFSQANAEASQASFEGKIASQNKRIAEQNAASIRQAGAAAEEAKRRQIRRDLGTSAAAISQAGTGGPSQGSNAMLLKQSATEAEFDARSLKYGYESQAYGQDVEAINQGMAADAARRRARQAKTSGWINAASAIVSAGASYSNMKAQRDVLSAIRAPRTTSSGSGQLVPY